VIGARRGNSSMNAEQRCLATRRHALGMLSATAAAALLPLRARAATAAGEVVALAASRFDAALYKATARAVFRSEDGCRTWLDVSLRLPPRGRLQSISLSAANIPVLYGSGPGLGLVGGPVAGIQARHAGGQALPRRVTAVAAHATQPETVYAYAPGRGIYRSDDRGAKWRLMDSGPRGGITRFVHSNMPGSMQSGWLLAAGPQGVRLSMDCFCGWRNAGDLAAPAQAIAYDPTQPLRIAAATRDAVFESSDGGQAWARLPPLSRGPAALAFAADGTLYAAAGEHLYRRGASAWETLDA
jgi:photosystem II stability/assembly factor-like uncharacterized protein